MSRWVLATVGADFEVVDPPEFRDDVRRMGDQFVRAGAAIRG